MIPAAVFAAIVAVGLAAGGSDDVLRVSRPVVHHSDAFASPDGTARARRSPASFSVAVQGLAADGVAEPYAPELTPAPPPVKEDSVYQPNVERWRGLVASVFPEWAVDTVLRIMDCESEGLPEATGRLGERGLMQIHPIHHDSTYDPLGNLWAAYRISSGGTDWAAWSCS